MEEEVEAAGGAPTVWTQNCTLLRAAWRLGGVHATPRSREAR
eukprot:CAMPEP_0206331866 /NCGR_PEP_ID=MMETSP0106_2-20121207/24469_1 /ASSEMBLY_ACC=CAM_ASM_000206 /TAXON_ID=81532 /ORGANISM="Acanthoeca-like sp., Strain 10tr" /LENGTH=41 /DNA_ID= /DNA_START= /DNA_END= /DNA_ORIENTATION=